MPHVHTRLSEPEQTKLVQFARKVLEAWGDPNEPLTGSDFIMDVGFAMSNFDVKLIVERVEADWDEQRLAAEKGDTLR